MTVGELRKEQGYIEAHEKIERYSKGFEFTVPLNKMPLPKRRAMRHLLADCESEGLIECTAIYVALSGDITEQTFVRL